MPRRLISSSGAGCGSTTVVVQSPLSHQTEQPKYSHLSFDLITGISGVAPVMTISSPPPLLLLFHQQWGVVGGSAQISAAGGNYYVWLLHKKKWEWIKTVILVNRTSSVYQGKGGLSLYHLLSQYVLIIMMGMVSGLSTIRRTEIKINKSLAI